MVVVLSKEDGRVIYGGNRHYLIRLRDFVDYEMGRRYCILKNGGAKIFSKEGDIEKMLEILGYREDEEWSKLLQEAKKENLETNETNTVIYGKKEKLKEIAKRCNVRVISDKTLRNKINKILKEHFDVRKIKVYRTFAN